MHPQDYMPARVGCEAQDCGALLEVLIPSSYFLRGGSVLVDCGACHRTLRVHLPAPAQPRLMAAQQQAPHHHQAQQQQQQPAQQHLHQPFGAGSSQFGSLGLSPYGAGLGAAAHAALPQVPHPYQPPQQQQLYQHLSHPEAPPAWQLSYSDAPPLYGLGGGGDTGGGGYLAGLPPLGRYGAPQAAADAAAALYLQPWAPAASAPAAPSRQLQRPPPHGRELSTPEMRAALEHLRSLNQATGRGGQAAHSQPGAPLAGALPPAAASGGQTLLHVGADVTAVLGAGADRGGAVQQLAPAAAQQQGGVLLHTPAAPDQGQQQAAGELAAAEAGGAAVQGPEAPGQLMPGGKRASGAPEDAAAGPDQSAKRAKADGAGQPSATAQGGAPPAGAVQLEGTGLLGVDPHGNVVRLKPAGSGDLTPASPSARPPPNPASAAPGPGASPGQVRGAGTPRAGRAGGAAADGGGALASPSPKARRPDVDWDEGAAVSLSPRLLTRTLPGLGSSGSLASGELPSFTANNRTPPAGAGAPLAGGGSLQPRAGRSVETGGGVAALGAGGVQPPVVHTAVGLQRVHSGAVTTPGPSAPVRQRSGIITESVLTAARGAGGQASGGSSQAGPGLGAQQLPQQQQQAAPPAQQGPPQAAADPPGRQPAFDASTFLRSAADEEGLAARPAVSWAAAAGAGAAAAQQLAGGAVAAELRVEGQP